MADPVLESSGESPKACVTNSSRPPEKLKGKENPDLPSVCSNYWPSKAISHKEYDKVQFLREGQKNLKNISHVV
jgi:hypothetical protein